MGEVIRPDFNTRSSDPRHGGKEAVFFVRETYGQRVGFRVCLIHDTTSPEGEVYKVVVGRVSGHEVQEVATVPATPVGEIDAHLVGMAVLRTLEMIATAHHDPAL
jgi:hypothetical protein